MDLVETPQPLSGMYSSLLPHFALQVGNRAVLVHNATGALGGEAYWKQVGQKQGTDVAGTHKPLVIDQK